MSTIIRNSILVCLLAITWTNISIMEIANGKTSNHQLIDLFFILTIDILIAHSVYVIMSMLHALYIKAVGGIGDEALSRMMLSGLNGIVWFSVGIYAGWRHDDWDTFISCFIIGLFSTLFTYLDVFSSLSRKTTTSP